MNLLRALKQSIKAQRRRGVGAPPADFSSVEKARWNDYSRSNRYLRQEHRELLRGHVKTVILYEYHLRRLDKAVRDPEKTSRQLAGSRNQVYLLSQMVRAGETNLLKVTQEGWRFERMQRKAGKAERVRGPNGRPVAADSAKGKQGTITLRDAESLRDPDNDHFFDGG